MQSQILKDKPGSCPICGMTLVLAKPDGDNTDHAHHHGTNPPLAIDP